MLHSRRPPARPSGGPVTHRFRRAPRLLPLAVILAVALGCSDSGSGGGGGVPTPPNAARVRRAAPGGAAAVIRSGGRHALLHEGFGDLRILHKLWVTRRSGRPTGQPWHPGRRAAHPGREGINTDLPYFPHRSRPRTASTSNANCLMCHGGYANRRDGDWSRQRERRLHARRGRRHRRTLLPAGASTRSA